MPEICDPPRLAEPFAIIPIDTYSAEQKYLVKNYEGRRFEASKALCEIINLIDGTRSISCIAAEISRKTGKEFSRGDIERVISQSLMPRGIVAAGDGVLSEKKKSSYLHLKIQLLSQKTIRPATSLLHILFRPGYLISGLAASLLFVAYFYLFAPRPAWDMTAINLANLLEVYLIFLLATLVHELGHSSACYHFGAQPGHIGIGLYLYFPVFYTEVSDVWRLKRIERAAVDIGGIYFQLLLLPPLYCLYLFSHDAACVYAIYLLTLSSLTALNPLFRFDGYWLVSDLLGVPNLRKRSAHVLADLMKRIGRIPGSNRAADLHMPPRTLYFLYAYTAASNIFFIYFILGLAASLPAIFNSYPETMFAFLSGLIKGISRFDFSGVGQLSANLFLPTMVLIMLATIAFQIGRGVWRKLEGPRTFFRR